MCVYMSYCIRHAHDVYLGIYVPDIMATSIVDSTVMLSV